MATITTINDNDLISDGNEVINNNFANLNSDKIETSTLDTDTSLTANSDSKIATQKAVKAYVDSGGQPFASETQAGRVQEATDAQVAAGTATGSSGAKLFITPAKLATYSSSTSPIVRTYLNAASPATWTKPAGLKYIIVETQGAGGSGGNSNGSVSGGGGGGGAYSRKVIPAASLGATETVTIGAASVGSGNTSFGTLLVSPNGTNASTSTAGTGGTATGGDFNVSGINGVAGNTGSPSIKSGNGGNCFMSNGGVGHILNTSNSEAVNGNTGGIFGSGGGGALSAADGSPTGTGGAGGAGLVVVTEYY